MAAHVNITDFRSHRITLTGTGAARGINGPQGAAEFQFYVETGAATVYTQVGPGVTDGTTDISVDGSKAPTLAWNREHCTAVSAPRADDAKDAQRVTVYLQTDTNPTVIKYRFVPATEHR